jgi:putative aldouronate transport system substrate-binding protein
MKKLTLITAILLCFALLFVGCTPKTETTETQEDATKAPAASEDKQEDQTEEETQEVAEEVVEMTAMGQFVADFNFDDPVLAALCDAVGVDIEWELIPNSSYNERLTIVLTSDEMPDIMYLPDSKFYRDCYEDEYIVPLTEYIANAENIQMYEDPSSLIAATAADGEIYGLPRNSVPRTDGYAVRMDWLNNLGMTLPENGEVTLDEFTEIMRAFTEDDPDGNGVADTYGLTQRATNGELLPPDRIQAAFGASSQFEIAPEGSEYEYMNPQYSLTDTSYLEAVEYTNMLWESGYIDPNWPANDGNAYADRFKAGVAGATNCFGGWIAGWKSDMAANFPDVEIGYIYGIKDDNGSVKARSILGANVYGYWTVSKDGAGKEQKVIDFFNYMLSDEGWDTIYYGVEDYHYTVEGGEKVFNDDYLAYNATKSYMAMVRRSNSPNLWLSPHLPQADRDAMATVINQCIENVLPSLDLKYTPEAASNPNYIDYQTTYRTTLSKIITGDSSADEWVPMLEGWYEAGGEEYIQEMNEYIKSIQ